MSFRKRKHAQIEPNLTSLIDVTFLLIVFFVLVSHLNEVGAVELDLPRPEDPATILPEAENQASISLIPGADGAATGYRVGDRSFASDAAGMQALTAHLATLYQLNPATNINIRADRATKYEWVEAALQAVSTAARGTRTGAAADISPRVNLMVTRD
jgi:biopolymer transport protein ExbD